MSNNLKYYLKTSLYAISHMLSTSAVIQIFMSNSGIDTKTIGIYTSITHIVSVLINLFAAKYIDAIKNIKKIIGIFFALIGACMIGFIIPSVVSDPELRLTLAKYIMLPRGILQYIFISIYSIMSYKLPYKIMDISHYGTIAGISGLISYAASFIVSLVLNNMINTYGYFTTMPYAFLLGAIFAVLAGLVTLTLKENNDAVIPVKQNEGILKTSLKMIKTPMFSIFIIPNLFRGFGMGVLSMLAVAAIKLGYSDTATGSIVTVTTIASVLGVLAYLGCKKIIGDRISIVVGTVLMAGIIFMEGSSEIMMPIICLIALTGRVIIDYAVPSRIYQIIDPETAGMYHAWRLLITSLGTSIATALAGTMIQNNKITLLFTIAVILQLISGMFYLLVKKREKEIIE